MRGRWIESEEWYWELQVDGQVVAMVVSCRSYGKPPESSWFAYVDRVSVDYPVNRNQPTDIYQAMNYAEQAFTMSG